ncbi:MAG TPA: SDR family NAD(P)-dependent oxidoreductase [Steroidobacteraceae bacterium]|nr:SDR family NAD(P)-dependent oxidoreductase [Steroidobacteraceae bacterium]
MHPDLRGKSALITGSGAGLGLAMARALARCGCNIVLHGPQAPVQFGAIAAELAAAHGVECIYLQADLTELPALEQLVREADSRMGRIDVLINNAVVRNFAALESLPMEQWQQALAVNLTAALRAIQLVLPGMRTRRWGRIFNMTSVYGSRAVAGRVDYVTTKTALLGLTRSVAIETLNQGVTCNAICPGTVLTPFVEGRIEELMAQHALAREAAVREFLRGKQPTGEPIDAAHVADMVVFLCGDSAAQITGAMLPIEGGWLAG